MLKLVKIQFPNSSKQYTYKTELNMTGVTHVVVISPLDGPVVVKVTGVISVKESITFTNKLKWIVQVVSMDYYNSL